MFLLLLLSLLRRPALLRTVPETSSLNMVSTRQRACPKKTVATQREGLPRNVAVQVSSCRECQILLLPREDEKERKDEERMRLREVERKQTDDLSVLKGCFEEFQGRPTALEKGWGRDEHSSGSLSHQQANHYDDHKEDEEDNLGGAPQTSLCTHWVCSCTPSRHSPLAVTFQQIPSLQNSPMLISISLQLRDEGVV